MSRSEIRRGHQCNTSDLENCKAFPTFPQLCMSVTHAKKRKTRAFGRRGGGPAAACGRRWRCGLAGGEQGCSVCKFGPTRRFRAVRDLAFQFYTSSTRPPWKRAREPLSARTTVGSQVSARPPPIHTKRSQAPTPPRRTRARPHRHRATLPKAKAKGRHHRTWQSPIVIKTTGAPRGRAGGGGRGRGALAGRRQATHARAHSP